MSYDCEGPDNPYRSGYARIAVARTMLKRSAGLVSEAVEQVSSLEPFGTQDLPAALETLHDAKGDDDREAAARWVVSCLHACAADVRKHGEAAVSFAAAAVMLRAALAELDESLDARKQAERRAVVRQRIMGLTDSGSPG
ncbi:hypothetical protein ACFYZ9_37340 [Streptomyces sp. NPDC001691]|uniref:hypothetical protein n=1 Tax=Streptomyces sp. NPDC001691 TaxID=3364600 RepID=UPI00369DF2CA